MAKLLNFLNAYSHIQYEALKSKLNKSKKINLDDGQNKILAELNKNGVTVIPNYYSDEKCDTIASQIDSLLINDNVNVWTDNTHSDQRIYASHRHSSLIKEFYEDKYLEEIGEAYLKCPIINSHTLGARLTYKEKNLGSGGGWHRDSVYIPQYKSIIYLSEVKEDNGPFEFLLGSHKNSSIYKSILANNFKAHHNRFTEKQLADFMEKQKGIYQSKVFTAKKGSLILVDTSGIHRGTPIENGKRYALTNYYIQKHLDTNKHRAKFEKLY